MILAIRADSPDVYVGVWDDKLELAGKSWSAGRELSNDILNVIEESLHGLTKEMSDLRGIIVFEGPGSYTGLRISISTANALGYSYKIPVRATSGDDWITKGTLELNSVEVFAPVSPVYGGTVYTTKPKK